LSTNRITWAPRWREFAVFQGSQEHPGLGVDLGPLGGLLGIGDDAGAGPEAHQAVGAFQGADGDGQLQVAGAVQDPHPASVGAPVLTLEPGQDLGGADLRGAAQGAGREGAPHRVQRLQPRAQPALDLGGEVHDVAEHLHLLAHRHVHRAVLADPAQVVAGQVHQHGVLGQFLGIGLELGRQALVLERRGAAPAGAGDGHRAHPGAFDPHQHLRRGAHQLAPAQGHEEVVGRRVQPPEPPVDRERVALQAPLERLRDDDLVGVAGQDRLLDLGQVAAEGSPVGPAGQLEAGFGAARRHRPLQPGAQRLQPAPAIRLGLAGGREVVEVAQLLQVVQHQAGGEPAEAQPGRAGLGERGLQHRLGQGVGAEVGPAHRPAQERHRQALARGLEPFRPAGQLLQGIPGELLRLAGADDGGAPAHLEGLDGVQADEREAGLGFAAGDRFQQVGVLPGYRQGQESPHRGGQVGREGQHHRSRHGTFREGDGGCLDHACLWGNG
jgi:hypothetical protein